MNEIIYLNLIFRPKEVLCTAPVINNNEDLKVGFGNRDLRDVEKHEALTQLPKGEIGETSQQEIHGCDSRFKC